MMDNGLVDGWFRPNIVKMSGYVPGEQPRSGEVLKLNTNENPYPPSPRVSEAIASALDGRLRLYPDPLGTAFREEAGRLNDVPPEMVLAGNGSDDLLTILTRAFVGPGERVVYPTPSYVLYGTLCELQDARGIEVEFDEHWRLNPGKVAVPGAKLVFLANPNSPSGTRMTAEEVGRLASRLDCPLVVDEAYADFAEGSCMELPRRQRNVIVLRTLSKGYSLAGLRLGYLVADPEIIAGLVKVKDSYNCDALSLLGGAAALSDQDHLRETRGKVVATRARLSQALTGMGYRVPGSEANFVWCEGGPPAKEVYGLLKERGVLVRLMNYPGRTAGLRITVGTDEEIERLLVELRDIHLSLLTHG